MAVYLGANGVDFRGGLPMAEPVMQTKSKSYTPTETAISETIEPDTGYDGLDEVSISVGAISSTYVGSGIAQRDSTDLSASGDTVSVPSGYYANNASKSVGVGTEGTPTATKGTVSSHSISVTPSVTNTAGYISGGTKTGTAVSVSASELVSGTLSVTSSGTYNVTNYASASVPSGTEGTPTATKGTVSSHSISVTPSVTNSAGYIAGGTKTGTAVSVSASELVSGTYSITSSGTKDVTNYASASVPSGTVTAPSTISGTSATVSTGTNTLTLSKTVSVTPSVTTEGYVSSGTAGNASVSLTASVNTRSSSDLTASGATVTAPAGYYASSASKSVASGTAGTPTATKGTVSNHSVSVTPSVTNTTGYITGSTKTGTAVTVSASELVSGSETKTENGTYDVTNLASLVVNVSGGGGSSKNVQVLQSTSRTNSSSLTKVLGDLTVTKTGTYDIYWSGGRTNTSTSYTWGTRLYVDGSGYGTENTSWSNNCQSNHLSNVSLTANQKLSVYARGRTGSYYTFAPMLVIIEA